MDYLYINTFYYLFKDNLKNVILHIDLNKTRMQWKPVSATKYKIKKVIFTLHLTTLNVYIYIYIKIIIIVIDFIFNILDFFLS